MTKEQKPEQRKGITWNNVLWFVLLVMLFSNIVQLFSQRNIQSLAYSEFKQSLAQGQINTVTIDGEKVSGTYVSSTEQSKSDGQGDNSKAKPSAVKRFVTVLPPFDDPELLRLLEDNNVTVTAKPQKSSVLWTLIISFLPWILIIGFFVYTNKKMREGMGNTAGPFGFGKSKAKLFRKTQEETTFADVAGLENAKKELEEIIEFLKTPQKFFKLGGELPKGILLVGPPGIGKTLMARATAGEAEVPFFSISGSEFIEMFVGVGASRVRDMFKTAQKSAPSIIFIDEIDSIGRVRGTGLGGGHDEREQTLNQILSEMDGFSRSEPVIVIAATNRPDVLDPALVRPGRFDRQITLDLPQKEARLQILKLHTKKIPLADDVDLEKIAASTVGFSGADLHNLVNESALLAARKDKKEVTADEFDKGRDKILLGLEREDHLNEEEKMIIAYHEAGHALIALLTPGADSLTKVTIIPRGRSLGVTEQIPEEDRHNYGHDYLFARLCIMLGGRAAEQLIYEETSTGAGDDLKKATDLARRMICQWGMSKKLGPAVFSRGESHPFLGQELTQEKNFSEDTAKIIDQEIIELLNQAQKSAIETLNKNRPQLKTLAQELVERETLSYRQVADLLQQEAETKNDTDPKPEQKESQENS